MFSPLLLCFTLSSTSPHPSHYSTLYYSFANALLLLQQVQAALRSGQTFVVPYLVLRVQREHIVRDAIGQLLLFDQTELKKPLKVLFDDEEGVDAGGVRKEFYQVIMRQLLDPGYGMFTYYDESRLLWFSASSSAWDNIHIDNTNIVLNVGAAVEMTTSDISSAVTGESSIEAATGEVTSLVVTDASENTAIISNSNGSSNINNNNNNIGDMNTTTTSNISSNNNNISSSNSSAVSSNINMSIGGGDLVGSDSSESDSEYELVSYPPTTLDC
jgi:hypothetical protein